MPGRGEAAIEERARVSGEGSPLVLLSYWHPANPNSGSGRMARLARRLAADGWPVLFVTGPPGTAARWSPEGVELVEVERGGAGASTQDPAPVRATPAAEPIRAAAAAPLWRRAARQIAF